MHKITEKKASIDLNHIMEVIREQWVEEMLMI